jgi:hypothetical protein
MDNNYEKPLISWGEIADFMRVSEKTARRIFKEYNIPLLDAYGKRPAIFPSTLRKYLEGDVLPSNDPILP